MNTQQAPANLETAVELARLRTELQGTNSAMGRIADAVEKALGDHETRLRVVEAAQLRTAGVLKVAGWLGAPATAGIIVFLARHGA